jgi:hypothetical protein
MSATADPRLQDLLDKQEIHELALRYCRGVDRKDPDLLRSLYTTDGIDNHGDLYRGDAEGYVAFLEASFPFIQVGAHYVCNHLVELDAADPDRATGEVYALGYHRVRGEEGPALDSWVGVRYLDRYRREAGQWRFEQRDVVFDFARSSVVRDDDAVVDGP